MEQNGIPLRTRDTGPDAQGFGCEDTHEATTASMTPKQLAALPYLVAAPNLSKALELAEIGRTTLYRWMKDDDFRASLRRLREEASDLARTELRGLMLKAVIALAEDLDGPSSPVRVRAARVAIDACFRADDGRDVQKRLDLLEDAFALSR